MWDGRDHNCPVEGEAFDDNLEHSDGGLDIWDMSWFGNLVVELGSSSGYFGKLELGFGTLGEDFGNLPEH